MQFTAEDYRLGALERLLDAQIMRREKRWAAAAYLAGRAAESMLRALLRLKTPNNESGHDLKDLLKQVEYLGLIHQRDDDKFYREVPELAVIWCNDLRFAAEDQFRYRMRKHSQNRRVKGNAVEYWSKQAVALSETIVNRGDRQWLRLHPETIK